LEILPFFLLRYFLIFNRQHWCLLGELKEIIRDAIKDLGSKDAPMVADLALAEAGVIPAVSPINPKIIT